jgi:UDP-N-acetyl-D-mannosaminuronate dehydrogenase
MNNKKIAVIGLGYVGLPLAHAFSEKYDVVGFDINKERIDELNNAFDRTLELDEAQMKEALENGMTSMRDDGFEKILNGDTTFEEIQRVVL